MDLDAGQPERVRGADDKATMDAETLTARAYRVLRQDILSGELAPGTKLRIESLRRAYDIGPSPLREALSRLVAEGLVSSEERRGFRIPQASMADLCDIASTRKLLECSALRRAIEIGDDAWEGEVLAAYHRLTRLEGRLDPTNPALMAEWEELHRDYHAALVAGANSPWLRRLQRTLYDQFDRYRRLYLARVEVPPNVQAEHEQILRATLARDADAACAALAGHIDRTFEYAQRSQAFADGASGDV